MNNLIFGASILLILILLELFILRYIKKENIPWKEVILNINTGHIFLWVIRGWVLISYYFINEWIGFRGFESWTSIWQWVFALFAWDFCFYWSHRIHHEIPFLWNIHSVHHQGEHYSLSLGVRNAWLQPLSSFPFFAVLAIIGIPVELFIAVSGIHYFIQFYNHNRLVHKSGWLEYVLITPAHHRVHHGCNPEYIDRNHGGTFVFWDKIFGTFQKEQDDIPIRYGLEKPVETANPFWANTIPFFQYFRIRLGWMDQKTRRRINIPGWYLASGGILLYGLLLLYIRQEQTMQTGNMVFLFLLVFIGTTLLGFVANGKIQGLVAWMAYTISGFLLFVAIFWVPAALSFALITALFFHGLSSLLLLKTKKTDHRLKREKSHMKTHKNYVSIE